MLHTPEQLLARIGISNPQFNVVVFDDFEITDELRTDVEKLREKSVDSLRKWVKWCSPASNLVRNRVPSHLAKKGAKLIQIAHSAGLQSWVLNLCAVECAIRSPAELVLWCKLQNMVLEWYPEAFRLHGDINGAVRCGDTKRDIVGLAIAVVCGLMSQNNDDRKQAVELLHSLHSLPEQPGPPRGKLPPQSECERMIRRAWGHMRSIGNSWPAEPVEVKNGDEARRTLDSIVNWCKEQQEGTKERAPVAPRSPFTVDLRTRQATISVPGKPDRLIDIGSEQCTRWLKVLADHPGQWISGPKLNDFDQELDGARTDRLNKKVPRGLREFVEISRHDGARVKRVKVV